MTRALVAGFLLVVATCGAWLGCSSENAASPAKGPGAAVCPNTVKQAAGASCTREGFACGIGYTCVAFPQQAQCTCTRGKFACTDATGAAVAANSQPQCVSPGTGHDSECPASQVGLMDKACKTAGLSCFYKGASCPENMGVPNQDVCQCKGMPLTFQCEVQPCNPSSDAGDPDQFVPPPPDASPDARDARSDG